MVKKRKTETDAPEETGFYQAFVGAANAVSHLYTHAQREQRAAGQAGSRQTLERIAHWIDTHGNAETISKWALKEFLNEEHMKAEGGGLYARQHRGVTVQAMEEAPQGPATPSVVQMGHGIHHPQIIPGQHAEIHQAINNTHAAHMYGVVPGSRDTENFQHSHPPARHYFVQYGDAAMHRSAQLGHHQDQGGGSHLGPC